MNKEKLYISIESDFTWGLLVKYTLKNKNKEELSTLCVREDKLQSNFKNKKALFLYNFITNEKYRNEGYGKYLLQRTLNIFKEKYDIMYLLACPFYLTKEGQPIYETSNNGLNMNNLVQFYQKMGFTKYGERKTEQNITFQIMTINLK